MDGNRSGFIVSRRLSGDTLTREQTIEKATANIGRAAQSSALRLQQILGLSPASQTPPGTSWTEVSDALAWP